VVRKFLITQTAIGLYIQAIEGFEDSFKKFREVWGEKYFTEIN
jgi:hypothetical protein